MLIVQEKIAGIAGYVTGTDDFYIEPDRFAGYCSGIEPFQTMVAGRRHLTNSNRTQGRPDCENRKSVLAIF